MSRRLGGGFHILESHGLSPFYSIADAIRTLKAIWPANQPSSYTADIQLNKSNDYLPIEHKSNIKVDDEHTQGIALSEVQSKQLLGEAGVTLPQSALATSAEQAIKIQQRLGGTVVMKIVSADIAHKTEVGGVRLGLKHIDEVKLAFEEILNSVKRYMPEAKIEGVLVEAMLPQNGQEVLIGVHLDNAFGQIMTFGLGGIFVEVLRDVAHRMLPLKNEDARAMIREIKNINILYGVRGQAPRDLDALEKIIMKVADFAYLNRGKFLEIELNPVWVGAQGEGAIALDALIIRR